MQRRIFGDLGATPSSGGVQSRGSRDRQCIASDFMALGYTDTAEGSGDKSSDAGRDARQFLEAERISAADIVANDSGGEVTQLFVA